MLKIASSICSRSCRNSARILVTSIISPRRSGALVISSIYGPPCRLQYPSY
jgi:hypothetical protein